VTGDHSEEAPQTTTLRLLSDKKSAIQFNLIHKISVLTISICVELIIIEGENQVPH